MLELTNEEINFLNRKNHKRYPKIIVDYNPENIKFICLCDDGKNKIQEQQYPHHFYKVTCKYCHETEHIYDFYNRYEVSDCGLVRRGRALKKNSKITEKEGRIYLVKHHPDDNNGIRLMNISTSIDVCRDSDSYSYTYSYKIEYYMDFIPGKINKVYKNLKRAPKEVSATEGLALNSKTIIQNQSIFFEDAVGIVDFLYKNNLFTERSGLDLIFKNNKVKCNDNGLFLISLMLMNEYPIIEQFLKMGYHDLVEGLIKTIYDAQTKDKIYEQIKTIDMLVNKEATAGKKGLRLPSYIQDYLIHRKSDFNDYLFWADIYDITKISKENFDELMQSKEYMQMQFYCRLDLIPNILKYGYTMKQLLKYLFQQTFDTKNQYFYPVELLSDYLDMCDVLNIKADKYPQDVQKAHDDIIKLMNTYKAEKQDEKIEEIALSCEFILSESRRKEETKFQKEYTIVFPKSVNDFVQEGINQRNCVGSYAKDVADNKTIVFFVRKKDDPERSFITAECHNGILYQCKYACNISVKDTEILSSLRTIAKRLEKVQRKAA